MARTLSGVFLIIWGTAVLVFGVLNGTDGDGAFAAGQMFALVLAVGMIALGVRAIVKGRAARA